MEAVDWHNTNGRYLAASLNWLRLKLQGMAPTTVPLVTAERRTGAFSPFARRIEVTETISSSIESMIAAAAQERTNASEMDPPSALQMIAQRFRLSDFERDLILLAAAPQLDTRIAALCGQVMGDARLSYASFALGLAMLDAPNWNAIAPQGALRHWQLVEQEATDGQLINAPLRVSERILHLLKGLSSFDPRLAAVVAPVAESEGTLPPTQAMVAGQIESRWASGGDDGVLPVLALLGPDPVAKQLVAAAAAAAAGRILYRLNLGAWPAGAREAAQLGQLWRLESALSNAALFIDAQDGWPTGEAGAALERALDECAKRGGPVLIAAPEPLDRHGFATYAIDVARPTMAEQMALWQKALADMPAAARDATAARLTAQFSLNGPAIRSIAASAKGTPESALADSLWDACRNAVRPRTGSLATRLEPKVAWDDLVLNDDTVQMLKEIVAQVRTRATVYVEWGFAERMGRGLGLAALFSGDSGTGKTYAAEAMASALRLPLYRIDLSQVVNKYIGETEKNLQRLFDTMEGAGAILFFDEADALFGKRSEVRDSHDRYANIEVNYLLQRMENYSGVAILATNMKGALDPAFIRRLRFIVPFNFPSPAERELLWEKAIPADMPVGEIDRARLARLSLTGASIRNVALNAAFLAADAGKPLDTGLLLRAARSEFRKMDRPINEAEFQP